MGRLLALCAVGCATVACNMVTGVDDLATAGESSATPIDRRAPPSDGGSDEPPASSSGGVHGGSSGVIPPPPPPAGDGGSDDAGVPPKTTFTDDFNRADGTIGNGWTLKTSGKFSLVGGRVVAKNQTNTSYKDLLVERPPSESALDVEVAVDATIPSGGGDPCLFARVQPASGAPGSLVSYTLYPDADDLVRLDHDTGSGAPIHVAAIPLSPRLAPPQTIRMLLRVTGVSPVHLVAVITDESGKVLGSASLDDTTTPLTAAGQFGFGSGGNGAAFDDFAARTF